MEAKCAVLNAEFGVNSTPHGSLTRHTRATKHQRQARVSTGNMEESDTREEGFDGPVGALSGEITMAPSGDRPAGSAHGVTVSPPKGFPRFSCAAAQHKHGKSNAPNAFESRERERERGRARAAGEAGIPLGPFKAYVTLLTVLTVGSPHGTCRRTTGVAVRRGRVGCTVL